MCARLVRLRGRSVARMVKRHDISHIPVRKVQPGFTLLMAADQEGKPPFAVQVDGVRFNHKAGETPTITITAAPHVDTGEPVILDGLPLSTIVTRVLRTYDDGA
jgi:hypothetical protein